MKLWTFQPPEVIKILETKGEYFALPEKSDLFTNWDFEPAYNWLTGKMRTIIKTTENNDVRIPVWAWFKYDYKNVKPDRRLMLFRNYKNERLIELDINSSRVLLSDYEEWHNVLNDYPALTLEEYNKSEKNGETDYSGYYFSDEFKISSWDRIFNVESSKYVQATFWKIFADDVVKIF